MPSAANRQGIVRELHIVWRVVTLVIVIITLLIVVVVVVVTEVVAMPMTAGAVTCVCF